jgi:hypothetical protein
MRANEGRQRWKIRPGMPFPFLMNGMKKDMKSEETKASIQRR